MPQPFINPYYYQQPIYQPQIQQMQPQYQQQIQQAPAGLNGRLIDNIDSVTANDVPMQGLSVFPKNDLTEVYIKSWQPNGTIQTLRFLPYNNVDKTQTDKTTSTDAQPAKWGPQNATDGIMDRLTDIENKIDRILSPAKGKKVKDEPESDN